MEQNVRPDFYDSQYLAAEDLDGVVDYQRFQHARHVLGAHSWGIAAGLDLRERTLPSGDVEVSLLPGIAWDGYGRTIVILAPARIGPEKFANFQAVTPADGQLIKIWLRYAETPSKAPAPGFEICRPDGRFARIVESFAIEVGEPDEDPHTVTVAGRAVEAAKAPATLRPGAPDLFDQSIAYQAFPESGARSVWLVPIGYVRWLKLAGQPGHLVARKDGPTTPDSDLIRSVRRYVGAVTESILAADGLIRVRDRGKDPSASPVRTPRKAIDPAKPPENDLLWVEGALHVVGDARVSGGLVELRDSAALQGGVPLVLRRVDNPPNAAGGKDLQFIIGADATPTGKHALVIGPGKLDAATGALTADMTRRLVVRDNGKVGIGTDAPAVTLHVAGDAVIEKSATINGGTTVNGSGPKNIGITINGNELINGNQYCTGVKYFSIAHPLVPNAKLLRHAALEGPEAGVIYRGEGVLKDGRATIALPDYFEPLTMADGRTVLVTPICEGDDDKVSSLAATRVRDGRFSVRAIGPENPVQRFWWEVKARRADVTMDVEVDVE